jgi:uncharacterized membrane protein YeiH
MGSWVYIGMEHWFMNEWLSSLIAFSTIVILRLFAIQLNIVIPSWMRK